MIHACLVLISEIADASSAQNTTLIWQTIIGVTMVSANFLVLKFKSEECRQDKVAMAAQHEIQMKAMAAQYSEQTKAYVAQISDVLKQNAVLVQVAMTLCDEIQNERERDRERHKREHDQN